MSRHRLELDGHPREYLVYAPPTIGSRAGQRALVLVLHGGGATARGMVRLTRERFNDLADRDGFYVVYPRAVNKMWDFGEGEVSEAREERVDDLAYFETVLDDIIARYPIDERRIFVTGISRGGQASYFLACQMPGRIRAIAPVNMPLPRFMEDDCRFGPPIGIAVLNGTEDPLVPYDGGQITVFERQRGKVLSTDVTVELWRRRNGCGDRSKRAVIDIVDDGMSVERTRWLDCKGAPVVLYRIDGGGHTWPSGRQYLPADLVGPVNQDIDGAEVVWEFFAAFD